MLQSRRVSSFEEVGCAFENDGDVVRAALKACLLFSGEGQCSCRNGKKDKGCILSGKSGFCGSEQVQVDLKLIFRIK